MNSRAPQMPVQIYLSNGSYDQSGTIPAGAGAVDSRGAQGIAPADFPAETPVNSPAPLTRLPVEHADPVLAQAQQLDPQILLKDFPRRWTTYIRANFQTINAVLRVFPVSERTARTWWNGEGGSNGAYVVIAMMVHPVSAGQILLGRGAS